MKLSNLTVARELGWLKKRCTTKFTKISYVGSRSIENLKLVLIYSQAVQIFSLHLFIKLTISARSLDSRNTAAKNTSGRVLLIDELPHHFDHTDFTHFRRIQVDTVLFCWQSSICAEYTLHLFFLFFALAA